MKENQFSKLLVFLERLDQAKIPYTMEHSRDDALMVTAIAPGEYWEIEFLEDGTIESERDAAPAGADQASPDQPPMRQ